MRRVLFVIGTVIGAVLAAFFLTFNGLFSDGPKQLLHFERVVSYLLVFFAHGVLAAPGSHWGGGHWRTWVILAAGPSAAIAVLYATSEPTIGAFAALYSLLAVGGAVAGAWLARR